MMLAHEEGHLKGAHSILGLMGITLYAIIFMMTVRVGAPFFGALLLVPIIFLLQYGMFTIFEMRADQYASTRGYKGELIEFLSDIAPKSVCNALRLWVLK
jgi:Zn-dependent protease with chaperone function